MTADQWLGILVALAAIASTAFTVAYMTLRPWWRTLPGRALVLKSVALSVLIDTSLAYRLTGVDTAVRDRVRVIEFAVLTLGLWALLVSFLLNLREEGE